MKGKLVLSVVTFSFAVSGFAQKEECTANLSTFYEFARNKNYKDAYTPWKQVYDNCPELNNATFVYGEFILRDKLKGEADKNKLVSTMNDFYQKYNQFFPQKFSETDKYIRQALLLIEEKIGTPSEINSLLEKAYKSDKDKFNDELAIYQYFATTVDLYNESKKTLQDVFDNYDLVAERIEVENNKLSDVLNELLPKEESNSLTDKENRTLQRVRTRVNNLSNIAENIDAKLGKLADCDNLIPLYEKSFEANKDNIAWLNAATGRMNDKDCTTSPLYVKLAERLYQLSPSASSALYLGTMKERQKNTAEAVKYFTQAVDLETDKLKKATYLVKIASKYSGSTAVSYAQKALSFNPSYAKAYEIIAKTYANSANECGSTKFEKQAVYWLAASTARKGGLENLASYYDKLAPTKADIFSSGMAGKTVTLKCWIGQSVKVPSL